MNKIREKQMKKLRFAEHCNAAKTIQVTEEIWDDFTPCQLDFGGCCEKKPHVEQEKKGLDIYM